MIDRIFSVSAQCPPPEFGSENIAEKLHYQLLAAVKNLVGESGASAVYCC